MELRNLARTVYRITNVVKPNNLAIGRVKKWNSTAVVIEQAASAAARIALRLSQDVLWTERQLFRFDNTNNSAVETESVIGRSVLSGILFNRAVIETGQRAVFGERNNTPAEAFELGIDSFLARKAFGFHGAERPQFIIFD
jgi:hypothetical protein